MMTFSAVSSLCNLQNIIRIENWYLSIKKKQYKDMVLT